MKRRTEIIIETERLLVISQRKQTSLNASCALCCGTLVTVDEAAALAHTSSRTVYEWVEEGTLHWSETPDGRLLICQDSLMARDVTGKAQANKTGLRLT
jgi:excisionase family DNA binding protein